ncbi:MAG TPA: PAS domain S-box protein, partial [Ktedonobacteraceae bacterium]|nr:PAS domain S-box protein [Ktedonobacteraceae bacterium]
RHESTLTTLRKDGTTFPVETHATRFTYKGQPHLLTVARDITERVEAEQQLREKEEQYRGIFEATTDGLIISDWDGIIVEVNPAACRMFGYSREEFLGLSPTTTVHPASLSLVAESMRSIQVGGQAQAQLVNLRKDGTSFPTEVHGTTFTYLGRPHSLGVVRDITERVEAEQQLLEREEQYRSIFESTYDAINIIDLDGYFIEVNPAFCRMFGYTREELLGKHASITTAPETLSVLDDALNTFKEGRDYQTVVARGVRKDGTPFYAESHGTTLTYRGKPHALSVSRDVTERVEAERQLRESEEQYRGVFETTYDGLVISDLENGCYVEVNPAFCRMFGYTRDELIGMHSSALAAPIDQNLVDEVLETLKAGQGYQTLVGQGLRKDGTMFYVESQGTTFTYRGKPHSLAVVRDITERVEAEQQLREREEQYRSVFEATTDGLTINDLEDGHVVEANPAACQMYGYAYDEMIGMPLTATIHPDSFHHVIEVLQTIPEGGHYQSRLIALRKDGTTFQVDGRGIPFIYKGRPHLLGVIRDITAQVQAEEQLHEKEEQYRCIFEATTDGLIISDWDGIIVEVNPAACRIFGYCHDEFIGLKPTATVHPDDLPQLTVSLQSIQAGGQAQARHIALRKDGTTFPAEVHGTMFIYNGKPHSLGVVRDITERMEAEKQMREKEEQYRSIFEASTDALMIGDLEESYVVEANPAACQMYGYTYEEFIGLGPNAITPLEFQHLPGEARSIIKEGGQFQVQGAVSLRKDGTTFYADAHGTPFTYKGKPHQLVAVRDVTERVEAERQLREKEEQYRSVFEATYDALVVMDLDGFYVEVNPAFCSMFGYTREELIGKHGRITTAPETLPVLDEALNTFQAGRNYQAPMGARGARKDGTLFYAESHSTMLTYQGKSHVLGIIRDITEQVQAQELLEQRVEERTRELASLLEISHTVASTLQLKPLVGLILDQLKMVVDYTGASILTVERDDLVFLDSRSPTPQEQLMQLRLLPQHLGPIWEAITSGESLLLPDMRDESPLAQSLRKAIGELLDTTFHYVRACLFVPLTLKDQTIGMLVLTSSETAAFTQHHADLALAIANQAAIAIENARLYEQAQELAAVEERQRLARELHDSVSQALYGISLGVHTARMQLDRDPKDLAESLEYVLELSEAALIEMRALIFELRPESLETEGLVTALTKQAAALQARQNIVVNIDLCKEPDLPLKVKQELYRVAQEALHNTVKHAHASKLELRLHQTGEVVTLEVCDDGRGFDATASFPGHLGLHSMQERVTGLGGELQIESTPGQGTCIRVQVPGRDAM